MFLIQKVNPSLNTLINFPFCTLSFFWSTFSEVAPWRLIFTPAFNLFRLLPKQNQLWTHKWTAWPSKGSSILNINILMSLSKKCWPMKNQINFNHMESNGFEEKKCTSDAFSLLSHYIYYANESSWFHRCCLTAVNERV